MSSSDFSDAVSAWSASTRRRMETVFHASALGLAEEIAGKTPAASGDLLASLRASASSIAMTSADASTSGLPPTAGGFDRSEVEQAIAGVPLGGVIHLGFASPYAAAIEYGSGGVGGRGMMRLAAQDWRGIVERAIRQTRSLQNFS